MNNLTALTSAAEAPYFARTWSKERGAATNFPVIRKAFFIRYVILAWRGLILSASASAVVAILGDSNFRLQTSDFRLD
jgi:hypothetical protein